MKKYTAELTVLERYLFERYLFDISFL